VNSGGNPQPPDHLSPACGWSVQAFSRKAFFNLRVPKFSTKQLGVENYNSLAGCVLMAIKIEQKRRIRIRNLIIRVFLVIAFAMIVLFAIENLVIPMITNTSISIERGEQVISNVLLAFVMQEESEMPLDLQVVQSLREEYADAAIKLIMRGAIVSGKNLPPTAKQICLTKLWVVEALPIAEDTFASEQGMELIKALNEIPIEHKLSLSFDDFCAKRGDTKIQSSEDNALLVGLLPFTTGLTTYYYPFDTRSLDLEMWVETEIEYEDGEKELRIVAPNVHTQYNLQDWELHLFQEQTIPENRDHLTTISKLTLQRAFASRLLTATLLSSLFIIIILLGFTNQIDAFIQASVAVLLTLLGIQDLLTPAAMTATTLVNQIILGLYILFALAVLSRLTVRPIWNYTRGSEIKDVNDAQDKET
jgi:hypothetical protein